MFRPALHASFAVLTTALLTGCAVNGEFSPGNHSAAAMTDTQLAAWSATSKYPGSQSGGVAPRQIPLSVIVDKGDREIKVYNFTGEPVRDAKLWVNRTFVAKIDGIAPQGRAVVKTDRFYDSLGNPFSKLNQEVSSVQLETADGLFDLQGPATE